MDVPWQIGHLDAAEYGAKAREAAKMMRMHDPSIQLVLCGSSSSSMPTYPDWDRVTLELCWEQVDYHSMHYYAKNPDDDTASYLALTAELENYVDTLAGVLRYVKAKRRSKKDVYLSWDEWNIWYKATSPQHVEGGWIEAPHLSEEVYNLEDALLAAEWMSLFLRKADVLKIACVAQAVNTISPLYTTHDAVLKHTTYYPILLFSKLARGMALDVAVQSPHYETRKFGDMPLLDVSASYDETTNASAIFIVNRSQTESLPAELHWQDRTPTQISAVYQMRGLDPKAFNTLEQPNNIVPVQVPPPAVADGCAEMVLPPLSFTVLETSL
jgi:alpha-N-arabinofuranosidase